MSISGIASSNFFQPYNSGGTQSTLRQQFRQLGQDLQSGNLSKAQSDFAALQQNFPGAQSSATTTATSSANSTNPISQAFSQLSQDLQAGNLTAAQSDYATLQQDFQQQSANQTQGHPHHHHHGGESQNTSSDASTAINQSFAALGQALQTGNLQSAQQSYASLQQELSQLSGLGSLTPSTTNSAATSQGTVNLQA